MRVLVTGATGFLGFRLCQSLLASGIEVRALVRQTSQTQALQKLGVEMVVGSLAPATNLDTAVTNVDAIAHCAGGGYARVRDDFYRNNLHTTENLLEAAKEQKLSRFVFVSSLAAHGPCPNGEPRDPETPATPITHYGQAKAQAESAVRNYAEHFPVTIIRPPAIYGPGDVRMLPLFRCATRGFIPLPAAGKTTSLIHVDDCVQAIALALTQPHSSGQTFFVEDGEVQTFASMANHVGQAVGKRAIVIRIPRIILVAAAIISELVARLRRKAALLTRDKARDLSQPHWVCNAGAIREELGWLPQIRFEDGAQSTAQWYREQGWIR
jgi:dihydroflavonol-4-reductase